MSGIRTAVRCGAASTAGGDLHWKKVHKMSLDSSGRGLLASLHRIGTLKQDVTSKVEIPDSLIMSAKPDFQNGLGKPLRVVVTGGASVSSLHLACCHETHPVDETGHRLCYRQETPARKLSSSYTRSVVGRRRKAADWLECY